MSNNIKLEWNVFVYNYNAKRIEAFNVFSHYGFLKDCFKAYNDSDGDLNEFQKSIKQSLMYYFWSKFEYEIVISQFTSGDPVKKKIDVFEQVMLNYDVFVNGLFADLEYIVDVKGLDFEKYADFAEQQV